MKHPTTLPTEVIAYHPMLESLPGLWADSSPELAGLVEDVEAHGIHEPLIVVKDPDNPDFVLLIDGRHRLRAAQLAGIESVPVIFRDEADAADIILSTLVHRRHYLKGALAYLSYPFIQAKLKRGGSRPNAGRGKKESSTLEAELINSALGICKTLGISFDTYQRARLTVGFFQDTTRYLWSKETTGSGKAERLTCRELWEPRILAGEVGLEAVNKACGYITRKDNPITPPDFEGRNDHLKYIAGAWKKTISHHISALKTDEERREAGNIIVEGLLGLPEDIFEEVAADIQRQRRARDKEARA